MRTQNFGVEIEMTGITRSTAAKVIAGYFNTTATHIGGCYDSYSVRDNDNRQWKIMRDASLRCTNRSGEQASALYSVEFVTPICNYNDIETIQELVRKLRGAGARVNSSCGLHCHINAAPHTPKTLRNIVNIMAAKEDLLYKALKVNVSREHYCQKMDTRFLNEINNRPPMSMEQIKSMWYDGEDYSYRHYDDTRYHALNLHSVFYKGTIEFRLFNSTLLAGGICSVHRQKHLLRILKFQSKIFGGAFHNESHHPHVHLIAYSTVENEGYLTQNGVENLRSSFARDIFQQDLLCIYERQTEHRDKLRAEARDIVEDLVSKINSEIYISASIQHKLLELADRLSKTKGKKVYGYLKPDVKALVDSIVDELANDSRIKKLYDLWYEQKENTIRTYTDEMPDRIPLAQNKEFKSIKNVIIKEALKLNLTEDVVEKSENSDIESVSNLFEYEENTSSESVFDSDRGVLYPRYSIKTNRNSVAVSSLYLLRYLCNIIQNQLRFEEKQKAQRTDKKLQQKINDKKHDQGLKM
mgnify:CR=1 FL=1